MVTKTSLNQKFTGTTDQNLKVVKQFLANVLTELMLNFKLHKIKQTQHKRITVGHKNINF